MTYTLTRREGRLLVAWCVEQDHLPVETGYTDLERPDTGNPELNAQIEAYFGRYRKSGA